MNTDSPVTHEEIAESLLKVARLLGDVIKMCAELPADKNEEELYSAVVDWQIRSVRWMVDVLASRLEQKPSERF